VDSYLPLYAFVEFTVTTTFERKVRIKQSPYRHGQALRVPGG